jgi:putative Holliday junction resolvase
MTHNGIIEFDELAARMRPGQRLLGIDLGSKTIGLALSDTSRSIASPLTTLKRGKFGRDAARMEALFAEHDIGACVIGLPVQMDGTEGARAQSTRAFIRNMAARGDMVFLLWDERLSTTAVTRTLLEADASRKRRAEVVDKMAAAYILQGALDRLKSLGAPC